MYSTVTHLLADEVGLLPGEVAGLAVLAAAPAAAVPFDRGFRAATPAAPEAVGLAAVGLAPAAGLAAAPEVVVGALVVPEAVDLADADEAGLEVAAAVRVAGALEEAVELQK